ncbi:MAG: DUF1289 domain-containing protein [Rhodanobacter sp.]
MKNVPASAPDPGTAPLTPCVGVCRMDGRRFCVGCQRSLGEIASWGAMSDGERLRFMQEILPRRKRR